MELYITILCCPLQSRAGRVASQATHAVGPSHGRAGRITSAPVAITPYRPIPPPDAVPGTSAMYSAPRTAAQAAHLSRSGFHERLYVP